eukprot:scaffold134813_cov21-Prasinocladus_malaysianus.AAC.2
MRGMATEHKKVRAQMPALADLVVLVVAGCCGHPADGPARDDPGRGVIPAEGAQLSQAAARGDRRSRAAGGADHVSHVNPSPAYTMSHPCRPPQSMHGIPLGVVCFLSV